jgi:hypothetical protein
MIPFAVEGEEPSHDGRPIPLWIERLGSDDYWTREQATLHLSKSGVEAIAPVVVAAVDDDAEVSWRAFKILRRQECFPNPAPQKPGYGSAMSSES